MCVQNLVPIGPPATTCIPSEGYTHTHTDRHTHTLLYRYRLNVVENSRLETRRATYKFDRKKGKGGPIAYWPLGRRTVRGSPGLRHSIWKAEPIPLLPLPFLP